MPLTRALRPALACLLLSAPLASAQGLNIDKLTEKRSAEQSQKGGGSGFKSGNKAEAPPSSGTIASLADLAERLAERMEESPQPSTTGTSTGTWRSTTQNDDAPQEAESSDAIGDPQLSYLEANLVTTFYHELGHALVDKLDIPIFGREEDAVDALAVLLIDHIWEPESALMIAQMSARSWLDMARDNEGYEQILWDVHSLDLQRYYNHVCLWYGADPEGRADFAEDFGLPFERAQSCEEEYQQAYGAWFHWLEDLIAQGPGETLVWQGRADDFTTEVIAEEVRTINELLSLPVEVSVSVEQCGEANAWYHPSYSQITICSEYADYLMHLAESSEL